MRTIIEAIERDGEDAVCDEEQLSALEARRIELLKERQKFFDQRNAFNKLIRERSRQEELNEILVEAVRSGNALVLYATSSLRYRLPVCDRLLGIDHSYPNANA